MVQRSRIAPMSEAASVRAKKGRGPLRPAQVAAKHVSILVLLACLLYALPKILGPSFLHDRASGLMASAAAAGGWVRATLVVGFESIPVR